MHANAFISNDNSFFPYYSSSGLIPHSLVEQAYFDDDNDALESKADTTNTPPFYLKEIKAQQAHVARLQKSLREANHKTRKLAMQLHKERKLREKEDTEKEKNGGNDNSVSRCNSSLTPQREHPGEWKVDPDSEDFLKMDDHLKENLRK